jgi:octaprenyl-diphosphate synthase
MAVYYLALDYLRGIAGVQEWPVAQALLQRCSEKRPGYWQLPVIACESVGGEGVQAIAGMAAIACLHTSILLIDDMLDADPKGEYHQLGQPAAANLAAALQAIGLEAVAGSEHALDIKFRALRRLNQMALTTALGQHWDVQNPQDEDAYWRVVRTKSAPFFGTALYIGALMGGAAEDTTRQMEQLGGLYGEIVQIHDDLGDVMETPANPDWTLGRSPLPVLFAQLVPHPEQARFLALRQVIHEPDALAEAQSILIRCGALSYAIDQLLRRYVEAQKILANMALVRRERIETILDEVVNPVKELLAAVGFSQADVALASLLPQLDPAL